MNEHSYPVLAGYDNYRGSCKHTLDWTDLEKGAILSVLYEPPAILRKGG
jgi:hypothetical protein